MITLRGYQQSIIDAVRAAFIAGHRSQLIVSPVGSGKTVMFSYMARSAVSKGLRVWILAHRVELLEQISKTLRGFEVPHGMIAPGYPGDRHQRVQVASVFALARRLDRYEAPDLIVIDEAHHAIAGSTWGHVLQAFPHAKRLGVTASPCRLSGEGLGDLFGHMVLGPSMADLIEIGALSRYRLFAPAGLDLSGVHSRAGDFVRGELASAMDKPKITGDALNHYRKLADGKRAVAFCVSVEHAKNVASQFAAAGIPSASLDGAMDSDARRQTTDDFAAGKIRVLTSCDVLSEGYDCPAIEVAILLRPTQSLSLYIQQVGRAMRTFDGKTEALILDAAGNSGRHGLPDDARAWSLAGAGKKKAAPREVPVKTCGSCFRTVVAQATHCICGFEFTVKPRTIQEIEGELAEVELKKRDDARQAALKEVARHQARIAQGRARSIEELVAIGRARGIKRPELWAQHVFRARVAKERRSA